MLQKKTFHDILSERLFFHSSCTFVPQQTESSHVGCEIRSDPYCKRLNKKLTMYKHLFPISLVRRHIIEYSSYIRTKLATLDTNSISFIPLFRFI